VWRHGKHGGDSQHSSNPSGFNPPLATGKQSEVEDIRQSRPSKLVRSVGTT
jgi:hypothetical protein